MKFKQSKFYFSGSLNIQTQDWKLGALCTQQYVSLYFRCETELFWVIMGKMVLGASQASTIVLHR